MTPIIEQGREVLQQFLKDAEVELTNEILTKMMSYYHINSRDDFYYKLGMGELSLDGYVLKESPKTSPGLLQKIFRIGTNKNKQEATPKGPKIITPEKINMKEVYSLTYNASEQNFVFASCCRPVQGDDVMGFVNDQGQVEVHSLTCHRAQVLKAGYGSRIVATRWDTVYSTFPAEIKIDGVDRHGILHELTQLISNQLNIDIRSLHIDTDKEVFRCRLGVLVSDTEAITDLCNKIKKVAGVHTAVRNTELQN